MVHMSLIKMEIIKLNYQYMIPIRIKLILQFTVKGDTSSINFPEKEYTCLLKYDDENIFSRSDIDLKFPKDCFYSNLEFNYSTSQDSAFLSPVYHLHKPNVALNKHYSHVNKGE